MPDAKISALPALAAVNVTSADQIPIVNAATTDSITTAALQQAMVALAIIPTGKLCEYRFDEGSGTVVTDYSGSGNTGAYVGSPTFVAGGGFTSASGKYATSTTGAWATMQTFYIVFDNVAQVLSTFGCFLGSDTAGQAEFFMQGVSDQIQRIQCFNGSSAGAYDSMPPGPVIFTYLCDGANAINDKFFYNGVEVLGYSATGKGSANRSGVPRFGRHTTGTHAYAGNIYYFASYSTYHTAAQILQNARAIRAFLDQRGTASPAVINATNGVNVLAGFGDSITYGQGAVSFLTLLSTNDTFTIYNAGEPSISAANLALQLPGEAANFLSPLGARNIATLEVGTNDLSGAIEASVTFQRYRQCAAILKKAGWAVIGIPIFDRASGQTGQLAFNTMLYNQWRNFLDEVMPPDPLLCAFNSAAANATYFQGDKTHPTTAGQQVFANNIQSAMNRLMASFNMTKIGPIYAQDVSAGVTVNATASETTIMGAALGDQQMYGTLTNAATTCTGLPYTGNLTVGQSITGTNIAAGTTISAIVSATAITLSANAGGSGSSQLTFGKLAIPANFWYPGKSMRVEQWGQMSTGTVQTLNRKVKFGSTTLGATGAQTLPTGLSADAYYMEVLITCVAIGASGSFWVQGTLFLPASVGGAFDAFPLTNAAVVSFDTTAGTTLDITDTFGSNSASNIDLNSNLVISLMA